MSAASARASSPHYEEALAYWDDLTLQCRRHVKAINTVLKEHELSESDGVQWRPGPFGVEMVRTSYPSTEVKLKLAFEHWGPKISGSVRGHQEEDLRYYPEEFEFAIGPDQDGGVVAITAEGRSMTAHEFAKYISQNFRRCYPGISLPCPDSPLE
jgi:hypothetical protein